MSPAWFSTTNDPKEDSQLPPPASAVSPPPDLTTATSPPPQNKDHHPHHHHHHPHGLGTLPDADDNLTTAATNRGSKGSFNDDHFPGRYNGLMHPNTHYTENCCCCKSKGLQCCFYGSCLCIAFLIIVALAAVGLFFIVYLTPNYKGVLPSGKDLKVIEKGFMVHPNTSLLFVPKPPTTKEPDPNSTASSEGPPPNTTTVLPPVTTVKP